MKKIIALLIVIMFYYTSILAQDKLPKLIPYRKGNLWGYCDCNKKIIISPQFDKPVFFEYLNYLPPTSEVKVAIVTKKKKEGLLSETGKLLIPCKFDEVGYWTDTAHVFVARKGNHFYKLDMKTNKFSPYKFINGYPNQRPVKESEKIEEIQALDFASENINITVKAQNRFSIIRKSVRYEDNQNTIRSDTIELEASNVKAIDKSDTLFFINRNKKWGIISFEKKMLTPTSFDTIKNVWEGQVFAVQIAKKWGLVWPGKTLATPIVYQDVKNNENSDGFLVKRNNKWGVLLEDLKTELLIDRIYYKEYKILVYQKLIGLKANDGKFLGYVSFNGIKYWD